MEKNGALKELKLEDLEQVIGGNFGGSNSPDAVIAKFADYVKQRNRLAAQKLFRNYRATLSRDNIITMEQKYHDEFHEQLL